MATVAVVKSDGDCSAVVPRLLELAEAGEVVKPGESVLIKPNLHAAQHWTTAGTTNPALVVALIEWARARGASRILVADGPYYGTPKPEQVFIETGMAEAVERAGAEWAAMPSHGYRIFCNASPHLPPEIGISQFVFECHRLINVAVMKTHIDCLVTLGMKNLKGCIRPEDKRAFHNDVEINRALVALNPLVGVARQVARRSAAESPRHGVADYDAADLTIVDGTLGMEGLGPHAGRPANFGHIFAGRHTPSVDAVAASAMGVELEEARTLLYAREKGLLEPAAIRVVGVPSETTDDRRQTTEGGERAAAPASFCHLSSVICPLSSQVARIRRRFERPYEAMMRELPGLRLQSDGACSACKLNVTRALRENRQAGTPLPHRVVVIGNQAPAGRDALLIGQCQREHAAGRPHLPGCPPSVARVKQFLVATGS
ncbi:MAG: DUF362 domain-containing protein [Planctomycetes bacterium]|nr:DUF362 domain-containing protein [Planctomycetota bacterium]